MKIIEINSEQWEIKESGIVTAVAGALIAVSGTVALGWVLSHLESIAWWWTLVSVGAIALGGLIVFSTSSRRVILRRQGASEVIVTRLIGGKQTHVAFDASQIISVNLDTTDQYTTTGSGEDRSTTRERVSILYVILRDNSEVMLATSKRGSNNGISINGFSLSGLNKAPLADEAQRIAAYYGLPLNSRVDNMGGAAATGIFNVVKQGIAGSQQPGVMNATEFPARPQPAVASAPIQPVAPVVAPMQSGTMPTQPPSSESASTGQQSPQ